MATATDTVKTEDSGEKFNLGRYLSEVQVELKKAEWPTRAELIRLTQVVLTLIFIVAVYCGGLDGLLGLVTNRLFNRV
ncbi:MAG: preprotein translocase subunit SecE [Akkermansiaceae bacterium]|nr:preprotein translocase subunit SecE [Armatimonadota bacterium]